MTMQPGETSRNVTVRVGSPTRELGEHSLDLAGDSIYTAVSGMDGQITAPDEKDPRDVTLHMLRDCQFHRGKSGAY